MATILIIDDNETVREGLAHVVKKLGHEAVITASGQAGIDAFKKKPADFVITDLKMEGTTGVDVLKQISALDPDVPIMIITGFGTVETAVEAMKLGAFDFVTKPIQTEVVKLKVMRAVELAAERRARRRADAHVDYFKSESEGRFADMIGGGEKMAIVRRTVEKVAASDTVVFIAGESGTGKELVAHAIHRLSKRANGPFIKVNCGALTETLLESELFGHEKGAFTGAIKQKLGRFELADGGTLFLDEVGDVPPSMQVKLLRALQEQEFERVGGEAP
ncbi:MAG TPA: sigma-54 dependent transcriptional regulator, partial [Kofleriaceae bacterium]|nr:sigma-54 dependent transcriptional regulator [Kofleriaceae bacterium]